MARLVERLFLSASQCIPALAGKEAKVNTSTQGEANADKALALTLSAQNLVALHAELARRFPEAGSSYWRIRCWGLVHWQPIFLALICVYQLKRVPTSLGRLQQAQTQDYVAGYELEDGEWQAGSQQQLIYFAGLQLNQILLSLTDVFVGLFGGKPVMYQALLADQFIESLVQATHFSLLTSQQVVDDLPLWAKALNLPLVAMRGFKCEQGEVRFIRHTCCLHYQREDGGLCVACPRHKSKKKSSCSN